MDSWDGANYGVPYAYTTGGPWTNCYFTLSNTRCGIFEWFIDNEGSSEFFGPNNLSSLTLFSTRTILTAKSIVVSKTINIKESGLRFIFEVTTTPQPIGITICQMII